MSETVNDSCTPAMIKRPAQWSNRCCTLFTQYSPYKGQSLSVAHAPRRVPISVVAVETIAWRRHNIIRSSEQWSINYYCNMHCTFRIERKKADNVISLQSVVRRNTYYRDDRNSIIITTTHLNAKQKTYFVRNCKQYHSNLTCPTVKKKKKKTSSDRIGIVLFSSNSVTVVVRCPRTIPFYAVDNRIFSLTSLCGDFRLMAP